MKESWRIIQAAIAAAGGFIGLLIGEIDGPLYALIVFVAIDYITGVMCAVVDKKLSSEVGARGIFKKVLIFAMVSVANIIDTKILTGVGSTSILRTAVIFFYLSNEGISLLENSAHLGLPIPEKLKDVLAQIRKKD